MTALENHLKFGLEFLREYEAQFGTQQSKTPEPESPETTGDPNAPGTTAQLGKAGSEPPGQAVGKKPGPHAKPTVPHRYRKASIQIVRQDNLDNPRGLIGPWEYLRAQSLLVQLMFPEQLQFSMYVNTALNVHREVDHPSPGHLSYTNLDVYLCSLYSLPLFDLVSAKQRQMIQKAGKCRHSLRQFDDNQMVVLDPDNHGVKLVYPSGCSANRVYLDQDRPTPRSFFPHEKASLSAGAYPHSQQFQDLVYVARCFGLHGKFKVAELAEYIQSFFHEVQSYEAQQMNQQLVPQITSRGNPDGMRALVFFPCSGYALRNYRPEFVAQLQKARTWPKFLEAAFGYHVSLHNDLFFRMFCREPPLGGSAHRYPKELSLALESFGFPSILVGPQPVWAKAPNQVSDSSSQSEPRAESYCEHPSPLGVCVPTPVESTRVGFDWDEWSATATGAKRHLTTVEHVEYELNPLLNFQSPQKFRKLLVPCARFEDQEIPSLGENTPSVPTTSCSPLKSLLPPSKSAPPPRSELDLHHALLMHQLKTIVEAKCQLLRNVLVAVNQSTLLRDTYWRKVEQDLVDLYKRELKNQSLSGRHSYTLARQCRDLNYIRVVYPTVYDIPCKPRATQTLDCVVSERPHLCSKDDLVSREPHWWSEQALCCVCGGGNVYDDDPIISCDACYLPVHHGCVGYPVSSVLPTDIPTAGNPPRSAASGGNVSKTSKISKSKKSEGGPPTPSQSSQAQSLRTAFPLIVSPEQPPSDTASESKSCLMDDDNDDDIGPSGPLRDKFMENGLSSECPPPKSETYRSTPGPKDDKASHELNLKEPTTDQYPPTSDHEDFCLDSTVDVQDPEESSEQLMDGKDALSEQELALSQNRSETADESPNPSDFEGTSAPNGMEFEDVKTDQASPDEDVSAQQSRKTARNQLHSGPSAGPKLDEDWYCDSCRLILHQIPDLPTAIVVARHLTGPRCPSDFTESLVHHVKLSEELTRDLLWHFPVPYTASGQPILTPEFLVPKSKRSSVIQHPSSAVNTRSLSTEARGTFGKTGLGARGSPTVSRSQPDPPCSSGCDAKMSQPRSSQPLSSSRPPERPNTAPKPQQPDTEPKAEAGMDATEGTQKPTPFSVSSPPSSSALAELLTKVNLQPKRKSQSTLHTRSPSHWYTWKVTVTTAEVELCRLRLEDYAKLKEPQSERRRPTTTTMGDDSTSFHVEWAIHGISSTVDEENNPGNGKPSPVNSAFTKHGCHVEELKPAETRTFTVRIPCCAVCGYDACFAGGGVIKKRKAFAHIRCGLALDGILTLDSIQYTSEPERGKLRCVYCNQYGPAPVQCGHDQCLKSYHLPCATQAKECVTEFAEVRPIVYCTNHSKEKPPTQALRQYQIALEKQQRLRKRFKEEMFPVEMDNPLNGYHWMKSLVVSQNIFARSFDFLFPQSYKDLLRRKPDGAAPLGFDPGDPGSNPTGLSGQNDVQKSRHSRVYRKLTTLVDEDPCGPDPPESPRRSCPLYTGSYLDPAYRNMLKCDAVCSETDNRVSDGDIAPNDHKPAEMPQPEGPPAGQHQDRPHVDVDLSLFGTETSWYHWMDESLWDFSGSYCGHYTRGSEPGPETQLANTYVDDNTQEENFYAALASFKALLAKQEAKLSATYQLYLKHVNAKGFKSLLDTAAQLYIYLNGSPPSKETFRILCRSAWSVARAWDQGRLAYLTYPSPACRCLPSLTGAIKFNEPFRSWMCSSCGKDVTYWKFALASKHGPSSGDLVHDVLKKVAANPSELINMCFRCRCCGCCVCAICVCLHCSATMEAVDTTTPKNAPPPCEETAKYVLTPEGRAHANRRLKSCESFVFPWSNCALRADFNHTLSVSSWSETADIDCDKLMRMAVYLLTESQGYFTCPRCEYFFGAKPDPKMPTSQLYLQYPSLFGCCILCNRVDGFLIVRVGTPFQTEAAQQHGDDARFTAQSGANSSSTAGDIASLRKTSPFCGFISMWCAELSDSASDAASLRPEHYDGSISPHWVHPMCAEWFIPPKLKGSGIRHIGRILKKYDARPGDWIDTTSVTSTFGASRAEGNLCCVICGTGTGAVWRCSYPKCSHSFHVSCARLWGCKFDNQVRRPGATLTGLGAATVGSSRRAYCLDHTWTSSQQVQLITKEGDYLHWLLGLGVKLASWGSAFASLVSPYFGTSHPESETRFECGDLDLSVLLLQAFLSGIGSLPLVFPTGIPSWPPNIQWAVHHNALGVLKPLRLMTPALAPSEEASLGEAFSKGLDADKKNLVSNDPGDKTGFSPMQEMAMASTRARTLAQKQDALLIQSDIQLFEELLSAEKTLGTLEPVHDGVSGIPSSSWPDAAEHQAPQTTFVAALFQSGGPSGDIDSDEGNLQPCRCLGPDDALLRWIADSRVAWQKQNSLRGLQSRSSHATHHSARLNQLLRHHLIGSHHVASLTPMSNPSSRRSAHDQRKDKPKLKAGSGPDAFLGPDGFASTLTKLQGHDTSDDKFLDHHHHEYFLAAASSGHRAFPSQSFSEPQSFAEYKSLANAARRRTRSISDEPPRRRGRPRKYPLPQPKMMSSSGPLYRPDDDPRRNADITDPANQRQSSPDLLGLSRLDQGPFCPVLPGFGTLGTDPYLHQMHRKLAGFPLAAGPRLLPSGMMPAWIDPSPRYAVPVKSENGEDSSGRSADPRPPISNVPLMSPFPLQQPRVPSFAMPPTPPLYQSMLLQQQHQQYVQAAYSAAFHRAMMYSKHPTQTMGPPQRPFPPPYLPGRMMMMFPPPPGRGRPPPAYWPNQHGAQQETKSFASTTPSSEIPPQS